MEEWGPGTYQGSPTIDMANRYFTDRHDMGNEAPVSFQPDVDPRCILQNAMGDQFVHLEENEVYYYESFYNNGSPRQVLTQSNVGCHRIWSLVYSYRTINPMRFRIGDIVEAQISFIAIPLKNRQYKMLVVLRAITLIDSKPLTVGNFLSDIVNVVEKVKHRMRRLHECRAEGRRYKRSV
jgi:hypothetical protein